MAAERCFQLPEGVLEEIMSWMPPESLMRSKSVSKSWYSLINHLIKDPHFVQKHLNNIEKKMFSSSCLVFGCLQGGFFFDPTWDLTCSFEALPSLFSITISNNGCADDHTNYVSEDFNLPRFLNEPNFMPTSGTSVRHCNGVICIAYNFETSILYNPAIKEFRTLPKPCLIDHIPIGFGFGCDSRANDYKIIKFGADKNRDRKFEHLRAEVYSLRTDSWREIRIDLGFDKFPLLQKAVLCKGVFYWLQANKFMIFSFDMFDEVFRSIPLPDNFWREEGSFKLAIWHESVVLLSYSRAPKLSKSIEIWVMDDCSTGIKVSCSWIRRLTVRLQVDFETPWAFCKNDELLLEGTDGKLFSYNLGKKKVRNLNIQRVERKRYWAFHTWRVWFLLKVGNKLRQEIIFCVNL